MGIVNLLGIKKQTILNRFKIGDRTVECIILQPLTEKQEEQIDNSKKIYGETFFKRNKDNIVRAKNILLYGEIDLNNEEDIKLINRTKDLINPDAPSNWMYSKFNFEKGICKTINNILKGYSTTNILNWFKYNYCLIGKPKRIIIYKIMYNIVKNERF